MRSRPLCCAALVAALLLAGCGDDGDKVGSKADFIAAADKICRERDDRALDLNQVRSGADLGRLSGELAKVYEKAIADLEDVSLPAGAARAGAVKYVRATVALRKPVGRMSAASAELEAAVTAKNGPALKTAATKLQTSVNTVQSLGEVADLAARSYGMRNCGRVDTSAPVS